jgi:hypothetical protein
MNRHILLVLTCVTLSGLAAFASSIPLGSSALAKAACIWPGGCITINGMVYPAPCMAGIQGTVLELAKPNCAGRVGMTIYIVVVSAFKSTFNAVQFKSGNFGLKKSNGRNVPSPPFFVPVVLPLTGCSPAAGFCLSPGSGNGNSLASVYSWKTTKAICAPGPGTWYWDMFPFFSQTPLSPSLQGIDIAEFTAFC